MGFIGNIIEKLTVSKDSVSRLNANKLIDRLNTPGQEVIELTESEAQELRKHIAERLGRELLDTPLPASYNCKTLVVKK